MRKVVVLVPTHHRSIEDIINLYHFLHIKSDAIFANQNGTNLIEHINIDGHNIKIVSTDTIGVSKNRNILLDNVKTDEIYLCIDDDCVLADDYQLIIANFFDRFNPEYVLFNGLVPYEGNRKVHSKKTKKVHSFFDVSYGGGPGLAFKGNCVKKYGFRYLEKVGYPNYIFAGEDSMMLKALSKSKAVFYRSSDVLFSIDIDKEDNSTYFSGFNDQFFITKGAIYKLLFPKLYRLITIYYCFSLSKKTKKKYSEIRKLFKKGFKYAKENL